MALLLLCVWILAFIIYFYAIWLWYLGFFPIFILWIMFAYYGVTKDITIKSSDLLQKYSLFFAWIIILAGLLGIFNFFGMDLISTSLWLIAINLFLWIGSYLRRYEDGKQVFQLGYYLSTIFLIIVSRVFGGATWLRNVFVMMRVMQVWVSAFFIFLLWLRHEIEEYLRYKFAIFSLGTIIFIIIDQVHNFYLAMTLNSILLTGVYVGIMNILRHKPLSKEKKEHISVRRILAGERITEAKRLFSTPWQEWLYNFVDRMPNLAKKMLELMNISLIVALIYYYVANISTFINSSHIFYWLIIIIFVTNVLLLKRIGYNSIIQNLVVFFVINFAIYISLFSYLNGDIWAIVSWGILRNIVSASLIFYAHKIPLLSKIFSPLEYTYWVIATVAALVVNVILLRSTKLPWELIFFLMLLYVWLEGMILFYAVKYMQKRIELS